MMMAGPCASPRHPGMLVLHSCVNLVCCNVFCCCCVAGCTVAGESDSDEEGLPPSYRAGRRKKREAARAAKAATDAAAAGAAAGGAVASAGSTGDTGEDGEGEQVEEVCVEARDVVLQVDETGVDSNGNTVPALNGGVDAGDSGSSHSHNSSSGAEGHGHGSPGSQPAAAEGASVSSVHGGAPVLPSPPAEGCVLAGEDFKHELRERAIARAAARAEAAALAATTADSSPAAIMSQGEGEGEEGPFQAGEVVVGGAVPGFRAPVQQQRPRPSAIPRVWGTPAYRQLWEMAMAVGEHQAAAAEAGEGEEEGDDEGEEEGEEGGGGDPGSELQPAAPGSPQAGAPAGDAADSGGSGGTAEGAPYQQPVSGQPVAGAVSASSLLAYSAPLRVRAGGDSASVADSAMGWDGRSSVAASVQGHDIHGNGRMGPMSDDSVAVLMDRSMAVLAPHQEEAGLVPSDLDSAHLLPVGEHGAGPGGGGGTAEIEDSARSVSFSSDGERGRHGRSSGEQEEEEGGEHRGRGRWPQGSGGGNEGGGGEAGANASGLQDENSDDDDDDDALHDEFDASSDRDLYERYAVTSYGRGAAPHPASGPGPDRPLQAGAGGGVSSAAAGHHPAPRFTHQDSVLSLMDSGRFQDDSASNTRRTSGVETGAPAAHVAGGGGITPQGLAVGMGSIGRWGRPGHDSSMSMASAASAASDAMGQGRGGARFMLGIGVSHGGASDVDSDDVMARWAPAGGEGLSRVAEPGGGSDDNMEDSAHGGDSPSPSARRALEGLPTRHLPLQGGSVLGRLVSAGGDADVGAGGGGSPHGVVRQDSARDPSLSAPPSSGHAPEEVGGAPAPDAAWPVPISSARSRSDTDTAEVSSVVAAEAADPLFMGSSGGSLLERARAVLAASASSPRGGGTGAAPLLAGTAVQGPAPHSAPDPYHQLAAALHDPQTLEKARLAVLGTPGGSLRTSGNDRHGGHMAAAAFAAVADAAAEEGAAAGGEMHGAHRGRGSMGSGSSMRGRGRSVESLPRTDSAGDLAGGGRVASGAVVVDADEDEEEALYELD